MTTHAEDIDAKIGDLLVESVVQTRRNRRNLRWFVASVVMYVALSGVGGAMIARTQRDLHHAQVEFCVRDNASRAAQLSLWGPVLHAPRAPLKADATRDERKAYDESTQARESFERNLHRLFDPVKC